MDSQPETWMGKTFQELDPVNRRIAYDFVSLSTQFDSEAVRRGILDRLSASGSMATEERVAVAVAGDDMLRRRRLARP